MSSSTRFCTVIADPLAWMFSSPFLIVKELTFAYGLNPVVPSLASARISASSEMIAPEKVWAVGVRFCIRKPLSP